MYRELGSCTNPRTRDATATATVICHMSKLSRECYLELRQSFQREMLLNEQYFKKQQQNRIRRRGKRKKVQEFKVGDRVRVNRKQSLNHHNALAVVIDPNWLSGRIKVKMDKDGDTRYYSPSNLEMELSKLEPVAPVTPETNASELLNRVERVQAEMSKQSQEIQKVSEDMAQVKDLLVKVLQQQQKLLGAQTG